MKRTTVLFLAAALISTALLAQTSLPGSPEIFKAPEGELPTEPQIIAESVPLTGLLGMEFDATPNYPPCSDPGDAGQLFDGKTALCAYDAEGTVGWRRFSDAPTNRVTIMIKLKKLAFLTMIRLHVAGGRWAGVALPRRIWVSVSVDGKRPPLRLEYFPSPDACALEEGHPFTGWLLMSKIFQLGRYVKLEFEMEDRGDVLLLDEIQLLGLDRVFVRYRPDMAYWTVLDPNEEVVFFGTKKLLEEGNLIINPAFVDADDDGLPEGVRVQSRELSPRAKAGLALRQAGGVELTRETDEGVVELVLGAILPKKEEQDAAFSVEIMTTGEARCSIRLDGPAGSRIAYLKPTRAAEWKRIELPARSKTGVSRITFAVEGKKGDILRVRNPRLAQAE